MPEAGEQHIVNNNNPNKIPSYEYNVSHLLWKFLESLEKSPFPEEHLIKIPSSLRLSIPGRKPVDMVFIIGLFECQVFISTFFYRRLISEKGPFVAHLGIKNVESRPREHS